MKTKRKHDPKWKDNTRAERIQKRRQRLNEIAKENGFESWSAFETAVLNGVASLTQRAADASPQSPLKNKRQVAKRR